MMTLAGNGYKTVNGSQNLCDNLVGSIWIIRANEFLYFVQVHYGSRVEAVSNYEPDCKRRAVALFSRK
jgi:hypothetical protein